MLTYTRPRGSCDELDADALRRAWYKGVPSWAVWAQHPRLVVSREAVIIYSFILTMLVV